MSAEIQTDLRLDALDILEKLSQIVSGQKAADGSGLKIDQVWLSKLASLTGLSPSQELKVQEDGQTVNLFEAGALNQSKCSQALLEKLYFSLRAMLAAQNAGAEPLLATPDPQDAKVVIHNRAVAEKLQSRYDLKSFDALLTLCQHNNVFALKINEQNGLVATAEAEENWAMSGRQWVTDTVRCGDIERSLDPRAWTLALLTLCDFYCQVEEMNAMEKSIADPDYYRLGGLLNGVAHIFIPQTLKRDTTWFNNNRLESHALALKAICDTVVSGVAGKQEWGFSDDQLRQHGVKIAQTVVCLATYLKSINTDSNGHFDFAAPSAGPWEEIPFPEGLTWDTEATRSAFESLRALLFDDDSVAGGSLGYLRGLMVGHKFGQWLKRPQILDNLVKQARGKVIDRLFGGPLPVESPHRPLDCSLAFIATSTITFADQVISDVLLHYQLLQVLEERLVRSHGIIRYAPFALIMEDGRSEPVFDSYLADNYWLIPELRALLGGAGESIEAGGERHFGSSDCSSHDDYLSRVKLARSGSEAQWCFVSVLAEGYCRQVEKLQELEKIRQVQNPQGVPANNADASGETARLIAFGIEKACEYLNRSYARITAAGAVKANGRECPAWSIPEAYEMVSPLGLRASTHLGALPGTNTPLAWGQASLFSASTLFRQILARQEECAGQ